MTTLSDGNKCDLTFMIKLQKCYFYPLQSMSQQEKSRQQMSEDILLLCILTVPDGTLTMVALNLIVASTGTN